MQWRIGDLLCREVGPPGDDRSHSGALEELEEIANDLGVALATLLRYRRMAATYPHDLRQSSASFSAHEAASTAADPVNVMAEAKRAAERHGAKLTVGLVREIAARPEHQKPTARPPARTDVSEPAGGWGFQLASAMKSATENLRRIVTMLQAVRPEEELDARTHRNLLSAMDRCEGHISWIRAYLRGEDLTEEIAEFLQEH